MFPFSIFRLQALQSYVMITRLCNPSIRENVFSVEEVTSTADGLHKDDRIGWYTLIERARITPRLVIDKRRCRLFTVKNLQHERHDLDNI